ncbi:ran GTPase-activating protein 1 [Cimex lectularius]|uniref:Ran GTPase-activating protein n=1 Tax=Cimex lectularius TaxID=79782 RepID=A0A8I6RI42_CIMLE|nr:ran GTPase-activating protein 1 [Cimex lectularius]
MANDKGGIDEITKLLGSTNLPPSGVSFSNRSLKINTADDAKEIITAMENCGDCLEFLNLEGNTLGIEGANAVAEQLKKHSKIKKALWRDMFTGRSKKEIPVALDALSKALMTAKAELEVLELSDNASGPIGVDGIKHLISSPTCFTLKELRLNNMGLGTTGGKMLASALMECYNKSVTAGKPLALKVFIAGRNRLENEGSKALANVFKVIGTLEEVQMPQNGINAATELLEALSTNPNLRYLNLNDNTLGKCIPALTSLLSKLSNLVHLDVGDCLLRNDGALKLAAAFKNNHQQIEEVCLSGNEIKSDGGMAIFNSLIGKPKIRSIKLNENEIGDYVVKLIEAEARKHNKQDVVDVSDNTGDEDDEDEDNDYEDEGEDNSKTDEADYCDEDYEETEEEEEEESEDENYNADYGSYDENYEEENFAVKEDYTSPLRRKLFTEQQELNLDELVMDSILTPDKFDEIINKIRFQADCDKQLESLLRIIMLISTHYKSASEEKKLAIEEYAMKFYEELFLLGEAYNKISNINNLLPAYFGIIKTEDKKPLVKFFDCDSSLKLLKSAMGKDFFHASTKYVLNFIFEQKELTK